MPTLQTARLVILVFALGGLTARPAAANPANKQAFARYFGSFLGQRLDSCAACHVRAEAHGAESLEDFPHNAFGDRLRILGEELSAQGGDDSIRHRLQRIADEDADGDGVANLAEILAGTAPGNRDEVPGEESRAKLEARQREFRLFANRYDWQPFQPVVRPQVPAVAVAEWPRNPIDHFLAAEHAARGLTPRPEAEPATLLRRVYLDLIGLSPSPEEIQAFLSEVESNPRAYDDVVDRLLANPAYGERWGRHWMDIWRYSDWAGYKDALRSSQRHIWHWRDWIVESLNADQGYDRMLLEMLAADELVPEDVAAVRATGYLARHYFANRDQWMDNVVTHTSQAFLGVTMGCAKCHDHMYDPISQRDYYAMRAVFERYNVRTDYVPGVLDKMADGLPRAYDNSLSAETWVFERGDERRPLKDDPVSPGVPAALGGSFEVQPVSLPLLAWKPDRREHVKRDLLARAEERVAAAAEEFARTAAASQLAALQAVLAIEELEDAGKKDSAEWKSAAENVVRLQRQAAADEARAKHAAAERSHSAAENALASADAAEDKAAAAKARKALNTAAGQLTSAKKALEQAEQALAGELTTKYQPREQGIFPNQSNGRRLAFAKWLVDRQNPLTARVAVNHIWLRHFGQAIVPTVNDFGGNGREPTHPALLDWLADEFMAGGWSMKSLHRLIVTSAAYRMASTASDDNLQRDPDNHFLWRMPARRMEGEIVRDNLLHIAGRLDPAMGGPDIDHTRAQTSRRRSIYLRHAHEKLVEFVQIFDGPSVAECYMREISVRPHQALALANSPLTTVGSRTLAAAIHSQTGGAPDAFIEEAFLRILARPPAEQERELCRTFLVGDAPSDATAASIRNCEKLVNVLFNHNDFVTIR